MQVEKKKNGGDDAAALADSVEAAGSSHHDCFWQKILRVQTRFEHATVSRTVQNPLENQ